MSPPLPTRDAPNGWTSAIVCVGLVRAFRVLPDRGIYSTRNGSLLGIRAPPPPEEGARLARWRGETVAIATPPAEIQAPLDYIGDLDLIGVSEDVLGRASNDRIILLTWARSRVRPPSLRQLCAEKGWRRETVNRIRKRACENIAKVLNHRSIPVPEILLDSVST